MQVNRTQAALAGILPIGGVPDAGAVATDEGIPTSIAGAYSAFIVQEIRSIDEDLAEISRASRDETVGVDEIISHCVGVWSRIKQLHQRSNIGEQ